jgi:hypothetical protein
LLIAWVLKYPCVHGVPPGVGVGVGVASGVGSGEGSGEVFAARLDVTPGATGLPDEFEHDATINPIAAQAAAAVIAVAKRLAFI